MKRKPLYFVNRKLFTPLLMAVILGLSLLLVISSRSNRLFERQNLTIQDRLEQVSTMLTQTEEELEQVKAEDQRARNDKLESHLADLKRTYNQAVVEYERILDLRDSAKTVKPQEELLAEVLDHLAKDRYDEASKVLGELRTSINALQAQLAAQAQLNIPTVAPGQVSNEAPSSGYSRQQVSTSVGNLVVSLVAGDLGSTRVIVDTASGSDCANDCPVLPLSDYVARNGGFAGINGSYFCPATYPSCAGKTNTFDLLVMNKDKTYFNSDNNVYSNNPLVVFFDGSVRFVGSGSGWGRDTSPTGVLMNYPLLLSGGEIRYSGGGDPTFGVKGNRSFVANKGGTVYIGVVHGATIAESALALKALGMENALNLDNGGSTALWSGGYKVGPGRNLPNAIVFVRK